MQIARSPSFALVLLAVIAAAWCGTLHGSVTTVAGKGKVKQEVRLLANPSGSPATLYTVPDGREFVITDFVVHNYSVSNEVDVYLAQDQTTNELTTVSHLDALDQRLHTFVTGPVVAAGSDLKIVAIGTNPDVDVYVAGYLRKS